MILEEVSRHSIQRSRARLLGAPVTHTTLLSSSSMRVLSRLRVVFCVYVWTAAGIFSRLALAALARLQKRMTQKRLICLLFKREKNSKYVNLEYQTKNCVPEKPKVYND